MKKDLRGGFTLIELMVVMAIIAVLSVLIIGAIQVARKTSIETTHRGAAKTIQTGLEAYYAKHKSYPENTATSIDFEAVANSVEVSQAGINTGTIECAGKTAGTIKTNGGGYVTYKSDGYTIVPADSTCTDVLPTTDQITVP